MATEERSAFSLRQAEFPELTRLIIFTKPLANACDGGSGTGSQRRSYAILGGVALVPMWAEGSGWLAL